MLGNKPKLWDIFDADFPFEDKNESCIRPVLVVDPINEIYLCLKITKNTSRKGNDEYTILKWKEAGLKYKSNVRLSKLMPISENSLKFKRGVLQIDDRYGLINKIEKFLQLYNTRYTDSLLKNLKKNINKNKSL